MRAYEPTPDSKKAARGKTIRGFEFLGCFVTPGFVEPSSAARTKFMNRLEDVFQDGERAMEQSVRADGANVPRTRYAQTIDLLDNIVPGWGHAVSFSTKRDSLEVLDRKIDERLRRFNRLARRLIARSPASVRRRVLGLRSLMDIPATLLSTEGIAAPSR